MKNSKLLKTLKALDATELKRLLQFLNSPFYNSSKSIVRLYKILRVDHPHFDNPKLSTERIFKKLFSERTYDHKRMINLMSEFNALVEKYMALLQLEKDDILQQKLLVASYAERPDSYKAFSKHSEHLHKKLDALPYRDEVYFLEKKELYLKYYGHPGTIQSKRKESMEMAMSSFVEFRNVVEMKLKCEGSAWENTFGDSINTNRQTTDAKDKNAVLEFYEKLNLLQQSEDENEILPDLTNYFISNIHLFRQEDKSNALKILLNYCNRLANKGKLEYVATSLTLYKTGLKHNCLIALEKLTESTFQNIVTAGIFCETYEWTKKFMEDYVRYLPEEVKDDAMALGFGQLYFKQGNFTEALKKLQYSFKKARFLIKAKALLIRIWFDLIPQNDSYFDLLMNQLESFEKYIRRDKTMPVRLSKGYLNFIAFTKKLAKKKKDKKTKKKLKEEITEEQNLILKSWLLERV